MKKYIRKDLQTKCLRYLSYKLGDRIPAYGKEKVFLGIKTQKSIIKGDSCNAFKFSMENHWGTHIDGPAHFFKAAKTVADYPAENWFFTKPCIIELSSDEDKIIGLDEVKSKVKIGHDILLLKTCFGRFRGKRVYSFNNPVVDAKIGLWLRSERPNIRVIGLDLISLGSHNKRELARQAHRAFLNPRGKGSPILIIEDMDLSCNLSGLIRVIVAPLLIMNIDSAPCTVYGIFNK